MIRRAIVLVVMMFMLVSASGCGDGPPLPPENLTVSATAPVTLSWARDIAATSYNIYRGTASGTLATKILLASDVTAATYSDTTAVAGTTYYYRITSVNWNKESVASNEVCATP